MIDPSDSWNKPWGGYNTEEIPADVDAQHINRGSEKEMWFRVKNNSQ
jgi:hypothetical protein